MRVNGTVGLSGEPGGQRTGLLLIKRQLNIFFPVVVLADGVFPVGCFLHEYVYGVCMLQYRRSYDLINDGHVMCMRGKQQGSVLPILCHVWLVVH
jgi:hypothetical protein